MTTPKIPLAHQNSSPVVVLQDDALAFQKWQKDLLAKIELQISPYVALALSLRKRDLEGTTDSAGKNEIEARHIPQAQDTRQDQIEHPKFAGGNIYSLVSENSPTDFAILGTGLSDTEVQVVELQHCTEPIQKDKEQMAKRDNKIDAKETQLHRKTVESELQGKVQQQERNLQNQHVFQRQLEHTNRQLIKKQSKVEALQEELPKEAHTRLREQQGEAEEQIEEQREVGSQYKEWEYTWEAELGGRGQTEEYINGRVESVPGRGNLKKIYKRESNVQYREQSMKQREESVEQREESVEQREKRVEQREKNVKEREESMKQKEESVQRRERVVQQRVKVIEEMQKIVQQREESVRNECMQRREESMRQRREMVIEENLQQREESLQRREESVQQSEMSVQRSEESVERRVESVQRSEDCVQQRVESVRRRVESVQQREESVQQREQIVQQKAESVQKRVQIVEQREQIVQQREERVQQKENAAILTHIPWSAEEQSKRDALTIGAEMVGRNLRSIESHSSGIRNFSPMGLNYGHSPSFGSSPSKGIFRRWQNLSS
ncbi:hypothetical protein GYMLUDRAFT_1004823 [Collybiopsis luxurians FD-317 M1]|uniref:Unplaced genomic scaffold GYMLUscaffold_32, whole genome shotgun sequence n=1 Tax=Collybiopsis luxurians FD-317 M1 TaxID=944289 RepID=A0A0D0B7D0_9AGAR|nr:hypothetical protein GYMLUDRAFT_1004823 [Collybiopsis luxurians FD-317 M1]